MSTAKPMSRDLGDGIDAYVDGGNIWVGDGAEMCLMLKPSVMAALVQFEKDVAAARVEAEQRQRSNP